MFDGRLIRDPWWLDEDYRYNMVPFQPAHFTPEELSRACLEARKEFYSWNSIGRRATHRIIWHSPWMLANFLAINALHHWDIESRSGMPLGDESWTDQLLKAPGASPAPFVSAS